MKKRSWIEKNSFWFMPFLIFVVTGITSFMGTYNANKYIQFETKMKLEQTIKDVEETKLKIKSFDMFREENTKQDMKQDLQIFGIQNDVADLKDKNKFLKLNN